MFYTILIKGNLKPHWFENLSVERLDAFTTVIRGELVDQAALYGVLNRIRDLGVELLSVSSEDEVK
ncbi:MAG: hypothetical protein BGO41_10795 [Clostridiales bacterium 38-18]|nr:MAG: hypothetical protein BGO41_10795 [Clostridiales bacterium 38-18]